MNATILLNSATIGGLSVSIILLGVAIGGVRGNIQSQVAWSQVQSNIVKYQVMAAIAMGILILSSITYQIAYPEWGSIVMAMMAAMAFGLSILSFMIATITRY